VQAAAAAAAAAKAQSVPDPSTAVVASTAAAVVANNAAAAPKRQLALPSTQAVNSSGTSAALMGSTHAAGACALDKDGKPVTLLPVVRHSLTEELHALLKLVTQVCYLTCVRLASSYFTPLQGCGALYCAPEFVEC
jgi:hypothetical protein